MLVKNYLQKTRVNVTDWPAQSLELTPTENLLDELKTKVRVRRPLHLEENRRMAWDYSGDVCETR